MVTERILVAMEHEHFLYVFAIIAFVWLSVLSLKTYLFSKSVKRVFGGHDLREIEELLRDVFESKHEAEAAIERHETSIDEIMKTLDSVVAGIGIVRFTAFENMGGNQSFSIAILDRKEKGVVLTSIYGGNESSLYAKPVEKGNSAYELSKEERSALKIASKSIT